MRKKQTKINPVIVVPDPELYDEEKSHCSSGENNVLYYRGI